MKSNFETVILIPNFNGQMHLAECLSAVFEQSYSYFKVIFVDDGSTDDSVEYVKKNFPKVEILNLDKNYGFTQAVNKGVKYCLNKYQPKYIALLNNDTKVDQHWLKYLITRIESAEDIAAVASNMLFYDNPDTINSQGVTCAVLGHGQDINYFKKLDNIKHQRTHILGACFGATLIKVDIMEKVGLLDDRYLAFVEDLDWGWRANLYGYKILFEAKAIVYHKGSASWQKQQLTRQYLCVRNNLCSMIKNYELKNLIKVALVVPAYYLIMSFGYFLNRKVEDKKLVKFSSQKINLADRIKYFFIPTRAIVWNIKNIKTTLHLRKKIQSKRKISDQELSKYFIQNIFVKLLS